MWAPARMMLTPVMRWVLDRGWAGVAVQPVDGGDGRRAGAGLGDLTGDAVYRRSIDHRRRPATGPAGGLVSPGQGRCPVPAGGGWWRGHRDRWMPQLGAASGHPGGDCPRWAGRCMVAAERETAVAGLDPAGGR